VREAQREKSGLENKSLGSPVRKEDMSKEGVGSRMQGQ